MRKRTTNQHLSVTLMATSTRSTITSLGVTQAVEELEHGSDLKFHFDKLDYFMQKGDRAHRGPEAAQASN